MTTEYSPIIESMREQAKAGASPAVLLRDVAKEHGIVQQIVWMELFSEACECNMGSVTAIGAWWHEGDNELSDSDLDAYIQYVIDEYLEKAK